MNYREKRKNAIRHLFADFHLDLTGCRKPAQVQRIYELCLEGYFSHEIAEQLGITPKTVQKVYRRYNFPNMYNFFPPRMEERPIYKDGTKVVPSGHIYKRVPCNPYGSKHGSYVAVHRLVMEEYLGRYLRPEEVVHHIDNNPANNDISNLQLFANNTEHLKATLVGKCPNWTPEGLAILQNKARQKLRDSRGRYISPSSLPIPD